MKRISATNIVSLLAFGKTFFLLLLITLFSLFALTPATAHAIKIIIHATEGPGVPPPPFPPIPFPSNVREITLAPGVPIPRLPGSSTAMDCAAIAAMDANNDSIPGDYLYTTEAGAACVAVAEIERYIKNNVVVEVEFFVGNLLVLFGEPAAIGATVNRVIVPESTTPTNDPFKGYKATLALLKQAVGKESDKSQDSLVHHLPMLEQLNAVLPNIPFYVNNPEYPNNRFKPSTILLSSAQFKALGTLPPEFSTSGNIDTVIGFSLLSTVPNVDAVFLLADQTAAGGLTSWDFNVNDNVGMIGPLSLTDWNTIDFLNPGTWPSGFNTVSPSRLTDWQGVIMHELFHVLGYLSEVDFIETAQGQFIDITERGVSVMDLYRLSEDDLSNIKTPADFTKAARYWVVDGPIAGACDVQNGKAVVVANLKNSLSIPMSSGTRLDANSFCVAGDCYQASHARSPFNVVPSSNDTLGLSCLFTGGVPVQFGLVQTHQFIPDNEGDSPPGMLMRPFSGFHNANLIKQRDLIILDLIGWDIDYSGGQPTSLTGGNATNTNENLMQAKAFEQNNNVKLKQTYKLTIE